MLSTTAMRRSNTGTVRFGANLEGDPFPARPFQHSETISRLNAERQGAQALYPLLSSPSEV